ncbi:hypothetical protein FKM82_013561 [Ascaphus truei]
MGSAISSGPGTSVLDTEIAHCRRCHLGAAYPTLITSSTSGDVEHQQADWSSIHEKICQLLIPLRTSLPFLNSAEERCHCMEQQIQRKKHLIDVTMKEAQKLLFNGKHQDAIPAATHSLSFSIDVFGLTSVELVPVYLILAEANIGLGQLAQAEHYLSEAYWTVLKTSDCSNTIRSKLHRNLGLLFSAKGDFEESLRHLSNDVRGI